MASDFTDRYEDIRRQVRVYLRATFKNNVDIDEVTDAVMEKLLIRWHKIKEPLRWAITAARHLALDELRKAALVSLSGIVSTDVMSYGDADQQLKMIAIMDALERLPPPERKTLILAALGYETAEIAEILRLSPESVPRYLYLGRKRLGKILLYRRRKAKKSRRRGPASGPELAQ